MKLSTLLHIHWECNTQWSQRIRAVGLKWLIDVRKPVEYHTLRLFSVHSDADINYASGCK